MRFGCGAHNNDCGDRRGRTNGNRTGLTGLHSTLFWVPTRNCEAILQSFKTKAIPKRTQSIYLSICGNPVSIKGSALYCPKQSTR